MLRNSSILAERLKGAVEGELHFDPISRGLYATDASIYQMMPVGVLAPKSVSDVKSAIELSAEQGIPVLARGGGTSQCGQTVNEALVLDNTRHLNRLIELDIENRRCVVEPGMVLDELNRILKPHGLWFPVDVSTASRATIGGMAGNNSCGGKSIRYGMMRDNVLSVDAIMADGMIAHFGPVEPAKIDMENGFGALVKDMLALGKRESAEIANRFPNVMRRVGGYNIDALAPGNTPNNLSHLLVGSEGTLAYSTAIELKLSPLPGEKVMGVCHFPTFYSAMDAAQHLVTLDPLSVELVDATMIGLARDIPIFRKTMEEFVTDRPEALLLVEFADGEGSANRKKLDRLEEMMGDLGFSWSGEGSKWGGATRVEDPGLQNAIAEVRKSGLNIMMSMKDEGKPVSFVEDCAVELPDLAEYTSKLTEIFEKHGTKGTWYAHASVGCLHVRPVLNLKLDKDARTMRAIAEEAFDLVQAYKGSHSGEHGDGIVRSEFHEKMFGKRMVEAFGEVKQRFDPKGVFNPGKIVDPPKMDDRRLFRYGPEYKADDINMALDWSAWPGKAGGFQGAVEMCNNNGACRKLKGGVMCPSYRVTRQEQDLTRGRANALRLAISGQLGKDAFTSDQMAEVMKLCVSCKGCKRECPTGVDMARMKIEFLAARAEKNGVSVHDRMVGYLPRYAPVAARIPWLMNLRNQIPGLAHLLEGPTGFTAKRKLPFWSANPFAEKEMITTETPDAVLFADCFNRYFEPENIRAAIKVMAAGGVKLAASVPGGRPLCCGRTFLSVGLVEEARREATRLVEALLPFVEKSIPVIGLEPSCLLTLRDEIPSLIPGSESELLAERAKLLEEFISEARQKDRLRLPLRALDQKILLHNHCHQKAMATTNAMADTLSLIPETTVETVETSCCGMAGSFGYKTDTYDTSIRMAELDLLPAVRKAGERSYIVANGTSCRHQVKDGAGRKPVHVAQLLELALDEEVEKR